VNVEEIKSVLKEQREDAENLVSRARDKGEGVKRFN